MEVYVEYAFAENCLLDGLLLYLALKCAKGRVSMWRLLLSAAVGGVESILFPLFTVPVWCAYLIKFLGGALLAVLAVSKGTFKTYLVTCIAFFLSTFALGGLLTAIYSFFDVAYAESTGYFIESAPVTLVLIAAVVFCILGAKGVAAFYKFKKLKTGILPCKISYGERSVVWKALADSGNLLSFHGEPVNVISAVAALALFQKANPAGRMYVQTVNGGKLSPVYACKLLEIEIDKRKVQVAGALFTVGEFHSKEYQMILHTAYLEEKRENSKHTQNMVVEN